MGLINFDNVVQAWTEALHHISYDDRLFMTVFTKGSDKKLKVITDDIQLSFEYSAFVSDDAIIDILKGYLSDDQASTVFNNLPNRAAINDPSILSQGLPGVNIIAKHPVTGTEEKIWGIIIELNDRHKWLPNEIAEWLENTLPVEDMSFKALPEVNDSGKEKLSQVTNVVTIQRVLPC